MSDREMFPAMVLDELAALDPPQRREVAKELRNVAETFGAPAMGTPLTRSGCWPTGSTRVDRR